MKARFLLSVIFALTALLFSPSSARADVSYDYFYTTLAPYGSWVQVSGYGYAFQPAVTADWRPYTNGCWATTDQGWLWVSNEDWGWATYHYGRWLLLKNHGWVWIPGHEWAPAWVSWRVGDGYIGWAPLPPGVGWTGGTEIELGLSFGDVGPYYYSFCPVRDFGSGNMTQFILPVAQNASVIGYTQNVTHLSKVQSGTANFIYNQGPNTDSVARLSQKPIQQLKIERQTSAAASPAPLPKNQIDGNVLRLNAPQILPDGGPAAKPAAVAATIPAPQPDDGYSQISDLQQAAAVRDIIRRQVAEQERQQEATHNTQFQLIQDRNAAIQQQAAAASQQKQTQQDNIEQNKNAQQQLLQLQQQQRFQQMQSLGRQTQIQNQMMGVQRLNQQAIEADIPQQRVQAIQQQVDINRQLQQNRTDSLRQQNQNQLQQMQLNIQQQQRTIQEYTR